MSIKALFITYGGVEDPSARVRVHQFLPAFRRELKSVKVIPLAAKSQLGIRARQVQAILSARFNDVVVVQKNASVKLWRALHRANRRLIWDVDDAVPLVFPEINEGLHLFERVVVGNDDLAEHVRKYNPRVTVIPSVVDEARFPIAPESTPRKSHDSPLVVGWVGNGPNLKYLERVHAAFRSLGQRFPGRVKLKVVSSEGLNWPDAPVEFKKWKLEEEASDVASFDVGLMPLDDDEWSRQKCGYKALLYMSQALPAVVSPVGANRQIVTDGVDGFHANTPEEWEAKLARLIEEPELRIKLGEQAREKVRRQYTMAAVLPKWIDVLEHLH